MSDFGRLLGESPALQSVLVAARALADTTAPFAIAGESGTGKRLLARAVTTRSAGAKAPLVELAGGADLEAAAAAACGGTLLIRDPGSMPAATQRRLSRLLGPARPAPAFRTVFVVAAGAGEGLAGSAGEDLEGQVGAVRLTLPPLRHRGDDICLVARAWLDEIADRAGTPAPALGPAAAAALRAYAWPGNLRELGAALERVVALSPPGELAPAYLPSGGVRRPPSSVQPTLAHLSLVAAQAALDRAQGNRSHAARALGISRGRLRRILS